MRFIILCCFILGLAMGPAHAAEAPRVAVTIKPVQSLAATIMTGIGSPALLMQGLVSPHDFTLKPSQARLLRRAQLVVWVGPSLETTLKKPIRQLVAQHRVLQLDDLASLKTLAVRNGRDWAEDHGHRDRKHAGKNRGRRAGQGPIDPHIWLDPRNARAIAAAIAARLSAIDPANKERYAANAKTLDLALERLDIRLSRLLEHIAATPYFVQHDAYQYFERRYGLKVLGAITLSDATAPSAKRLTTIRRKIRQNGAACVFHEPQFSSKLANVVIAGTAARRGRLDPFGANIASGPGAYAATMVQLASDLAGCLDPKS
jgi:zinc transport system substrate-binding protein